MRKKMATSAHCYDLISSPMMLNKVIKQHMFETLTRYDLDVSGYLDDTESRTELANELAEGRGFKRTATTLLDRSATRDELVR